MTIKTIVGGLLVALGLAIPPARAQDAADYPSRPITFVLPGVGAGGTSDVLTRLIGDHLTSYWNQPIVVDVKPGGAQGMVGLGAALQAAPDGYTVGLVHVNNIAVAPHTMKPPFEPFKDVTYVAMVSIYPSLLAVGEQVPAKTIAEFIALMKSKPGDIAFGNSGPNGLMDLSAKLLAQAAGVEINNVSYKSQPEAINAILSGEIQAAFVTPGNVMGHLSSGKMRALAVTTKNRLPNLPDLPSINETIPGYEAIQWIGFGVHSATPKPIVEKLQAGIARALKEKDVQDKLTQFFDSGDVSIDSPEKFKAFAEREYGVWGKVITKP